MNEAYLDKLISSSEKLMYGDEEWAAATDI